MTKPAPYLRHAARERLLWQRATDERVMDAILGRVIRDIPLPDTPAHALTGDDTAPSFRGTHQK